MGEVAEYADGKLVRTWQPGHERTCSRQQTKPGTGQQGLVHALRTAFLPDGFPDSVSADYSGALQQAAVYIRLACRSGAHEVSCLQPTLSGTPCKPHPATAEVSWPAMQCSLG